MIQKILTITVMSFSFLGLFGQTNNLFKTTDVAEFEKMVETLDRLLEGLDAKVTFTASLPVEEASETLRKYL